MVFKTVCDSALSRLTFICAIANRRVVRSSVVNIHEQKAELYFGTRMSELSEAAVGWQASFSGSHFGANLCPFSFAFCCLRRSGRTAARWVGAAGRALRGVALRARLESLMLSTGKLEAHAAGDGLSRSP